MVKKRSVSSIVSKLREQLRKRFSSDSKLHSGLVFELVLTSHCLVRCSKQDLSACVVDAAEDTERHFSVDNLRQLFKFNENTPCDTHDTFKCKRCRDGKQVIKAPALLYGDTSR